MANSIIGWIVQETEKLPYLGSMLMKLEKRAYVRHIHRVKRAAGGQALKAGDGTIIRGLFSGMKLHDEQSWGFDVYSTVTGQYEKELMPLLLDVARSDYPLIVDIGCANGLYAVGMALQSPNSVVYAYDIDPAARRITHLNAQLNDVGDRVVIKQEATCEVLDELIRTHDRAFLICDIEGGEIDLLDPQACSALKNADMLVELHGDIPETLSVIQDRFASSHRMQVIERESRSPFDDSFLTVDSEDDAWICVSEGRHFSKQNWLYLTSHIKNPSV